jgi:hypothetical protein
VGASSHKYLLSRFTLIAAAVGDGGVFPRILVIPRYPIAGLLGVPEFLCRVIYKPSQSSLRCELQQLVKDFMDVPEFLCRVK